MRRLVAIAVGLIAAIALAAAVPASDERDGDYLVRAVFDNGSFIVAGEDVRIAGAKAGTVESVDVSLPGEVVSEKPGKEVREGKAIVVLRITDPGFQDFRADATCIIRPQSLIGERYVNCRPTRPRPPEEPLPEPLERIPDGRPGAGQYLLPLENNGTTVDVDLVQNVMRLPIRQRFRLILNDLGAGFAARGKEIAEIVRRADPALRDGDRVLAILARQRHQLAELASDSERILGPLTRERDHVAGFIDRAGQAAAATAERRADLELALARFPRFLRELRSTMQKFQGFSESALPVATELGRAAPSLTDATETLAPFSEASTRALTALGDAAEPSGPKLAAADPVIRQARDLAKSGVRPTKDLAALLESTRDTKGFEGLMDLIYNTTGSVNGFDEHGHFLRTSLVATNCVDYSIGWASGCDARFEGAAGKGPPITNFPLITGTLRPQADPDGEASPSAEREPPERATPEPAGDAGEASATLDLGAASAGAPPSSPGQGAGAMRERRPDSRPRPGAVRDLLDFLVGP